MRVFPAQSDKKGEEDEEEGQITKEGRELEQCAPNGPYLYTR